LVVHVAFVRHRFAAVVLIRHEADDDYHAVLTVRQLL
jgi:hypothetical protein